MTTRKRLLFVLIASALLVAGGWYLARGPIAPSPESVPLQQEPAPPVESSVEGQHVLTPDLGVGGTRAEMRSEITETETEVATQEDVLRGRVISDVLGTPLAGARVTIVHRLHGEFRIVDPMHSDASRPVGEVATDVEGRFEVTVPAAVPLDVEVTARGYATARRSHLFAGDDVELRLSLAAILEGVLTRESDGAPVEGALVRGWDVGRVEQCRMRTGPGGTFFFDDLQAGVLTVEITPRDVVAPPWKKIELRAGTRIRLDLKLETGVKVQGTVSDSEGRPIAGAEIGEGSTFRKSAFSDALGWYELVGFGGTTVRDIRVRAVGYGGERHEYPKEALPSEDMRLDFVLEPARSAIGRVVDSEGAPLEGVYVAGVGTQRVQGELRSDWESSVTGADGRFELTSLHVALGHQLFLRKEGFGTRVYDFPSDEGQRARIDFGDFLLLPGARVEGTLRTFEGAPIPDHVVKLRGCNGDFDRFRPDADATSASWRTTVRESRTDTRGRFHFADVPGGEFRVTASVRGKPALAASATVQVPEVGPVEDVELALDFGAPITGVVLKPDGSPAIGVFVHELTGEQQGRIHAVSGAGGRFQLLGTSAEKGDVVLVTSLASYNWGNPDARLAASPPVAARAGGTDVTLTLRDLVLLTGRVEDAAGQPVANRLISAFPSGSSPRLGAALATTSTDEAGAFHMELPEGARVDLETSTLEPDVGADSFARSPSEPARLHSIASDARGVVLRFAE